MKRVRLTQRNRKAQSQADGLFPGDVGNMERSKSYRDIDHYHTFEQTVNHELPDMRHEWKDDKRDENNIPIPKVAELYAAAQNAIKLSMMFLGDNAPQKMIQAQARDFMKLGNTRLVASLNRWYETEQDEVQTEEVVEETEGETIQADEMVEETVQTEVTEEPVVEQSEDDEELPVTEVADDEVIEETEDEFIETEDEEIEIEQQVLNTDVDFDTTSDDIQADADEELESVFEDEVTMEDDNNEVVASRKASKKQGVKKIACQPKLLRVASKKSDELEKLWERIDAPGIN